MNQRVVKKIRRAARRNWMEYIKALYELPFKNRLLFAWHIIRKTR